MNKVVRPKHQALILKCYPKYQKNAQEVKANSSELSYLLFYASTRKSKLQKVCEFLEKRTSKDVWKGRIGNVQVTLQILKSLIEKCPRDLSLYAPGVLRVLRTILQSSDVTMVEETISVFSTFCAHQDPAMLAANQEYIRQWEEIIQMYRSFASKDPKKQSKNAISVPVAFRLRKAGLQAIKSVAMSDSINSETGKQLSIILPAILENMHSDQGSVYLHHLQERETVKKEMEKEIAFRRRQSISTVRTTETAEADPIAASGTTEDADKLAEEESGLLALQALRQIFTVVNRGQLRLATIPVIEIVFGLAERPDTSSSKSAATASWSTTILEMISNWAPVQDRYIIVVTLVDHLIQTVNVERQLLLATILQWLLSSNVNFIGLSVMDVLVGLMQHILVLIQPSSAKRADNASPDAGTPTGGETMRPSSGSRRRLLETLQNCIGSLATHVYYTDQISDMISTILLKLKPNPLLGPPSTAAAIQDPVAAAEAVASAVNMPDSTGPEAEYNFDRARVRALAVAKNILIVASSHTLEGGFVAVSRNRVPMSIWEGTQWLLRDPSGDVRTAYVDAFLTWLECETRKADFQVHPERATRSEKREEKQNGNKVARRAISNASRRARSPDRNTFTFLQLLHLAIYEHAHQYSWSESDMLLLHLLLSRTVERLGINAARSGLPMMMKLQEDLILIENPNARIHLGSLVHGYLWALGSTFDFETTAVGRQIHSEISRRNQNGLWLGTITMPPLTLTQFKPPSPDPRVAAVSPDVFRQEGLRLFDNRTDLVTAISVGYASTLMSPPSSPAGSPGKSIANPILSVRPSSPQMQRSLTFRPPPELSQSVRDDLSSSWSKLDVIAATTSRTTRSASASGTGSGSRKYLSVGGTETNENGNEPQNSRHSVAHRLRPTSGTYGLVGAHSATLTANQAAGHMSMQAQIADTNSHRASVPATVLSTSSIRSTVRVDDLKRVLSGKSSTHPRLPTGYANASADGESESMVSGNFSDSSDDDGTTQQATRSRSGTVGTTGTSGTGNRGAPIIVQPGDGKDEDQVPDIPPLPQGIRLSLPPGAHPSPFPSLYLTQSRSQSSFGGGSQQGKSGGWAESHLGQLLGSIELGGGEGGKPVKPPY